MSPPRLVLAGTHSDATTSILGLALADAFTRRGRRVLSFSVGASLVPPVAADRIGIQRTRMLDPWTAGSEWIVPLFLHGVGDRGMGDRGMGDRGVATTSPGDLAIVTGRTALHDTAAGRSGHGVVARVAALISAPVVLVVDAERSGRSTAAVVHGFATFDRDVPIAGALLVGVEDDFHRGDVAAAIASLGIPVMGALPTGAIPSSLERMDRIGTRLALGPDTVGALDGLRRAVESHVDLGVLERAADEALSLAGRPWSAREAVRHPVPASNAPMSRPGAEIGRDEDDLHPSVHSSRGAGPARRTFRGSLRAVKGGREPDAGQGGSEVADAESGILVPGRDVKVAVCRFGADGTQPENLEVLAACGVELVGVDLLDDERLPDGVSAVLCAGAADHAALCGAAANDSLRRDLLDALSRGVALYAETAGAVLLSGSLDGEPMLDLTPVRVSTAGPVDSLVTGRARRDASIAVRDDELRGYVRHALCLEPVDRGDSRLGSGATPLLPFATWEPLWHLTGDRLHADDGVCAGRVAMGTLHLHWAVDTRPALRFARAAADAPVWSR